MYPDVLRAASRHRPSWFPLSSGNVKMAPSCEVATGCFSSSHSDLNSCKLSPTPATKAIKLFMFPIYIDCFYHLILKICIPSFLLEATVQNFSQTVLRTSEICLLHWNIFHMMCTKITNYMQTKNGTVYVPSHVLHILTFSFFRPFNNPVGSVS